MKNCRPYGISLQGVTSIRLQGKRSKLKKKSKIQKLANYKLPQNNVDSPEDFLCYQNLLNEKQQPQNKKENNIKLQNIQIRHQHIQIKKMHPIQYSSNQFKEQVIEKTIKNLKNVEYQLIPKQQIKISFIQQLKQKNGQEKNKNQKQIPSLINSFHNDKKFQKENPRKVTKRIHNQWMCKKCNKFYVNQKRYHTHNKLKHYIQKQVKKQKIQQQIISSVQIIQILCNWQERIFTIYQSIKEIVPQIVNHHSSYCFIIKLNLKIPADFYLLELYESFQSQVCKISIIIFIQQIKLFLSQHKFIQKLWNLSFVNMSLIFNIFYGWMQQRTTRTRINESGSNQLIIPTNIDNFLLQMFVIFNQWCYFKGYCETLVSKSCRQVK